MTIDEHDAKVKALPPALRRLHRQFDKPAREFWKATYDHGCPADCTWIAICARPERPWCPVHEMLTKMWHPLQIMRDSLEWFLLDGPMPELYRDTYVNGKTRYEAIP